MATITPEAEELPRRPVRSMARRVGDRGATMVEYALLVAVLAIALVAAWSFFASALDSSAEDSGSRLDSLVSDD